MLHGVNPWLAMWGRPRNAVRAVVSTNPSYGVFYLATIYALQHFFYFSNYWSLGLSSSFYVILVIALALSPIIGWFWVCLTGWILRFTGSWLNGKAPTSHLRAAVAWSKIPTSISLVMWFILLLSHPDHVFIQDARGPTTLFINFIILILTIWSFVLLIQSIREVQSFSTWRAILNVFIAWIIFSIFMFLLFAFFRFLYIKIVL